MWRQSPLANNVNSDSEQVLQLLDEHAVIHKTAIEIESHQKIKVRRIRIPARDGAENPHIVRSMTCGHALNLVSAFKNVFL